MMTRVTENAAAAPLNPYRLISIRLTGILMSAEMAVTMAGGHMIVCACSVCTHHRIVECWQTTTDNGPRCCAIPCG